MFSSVPWPRQSPAWIKTSPSGIAGMRQCRLWVSEIQTSFILAPPVASATRVPKTNPYTGALGPYFAHRLHHDGDGPQIPIRETLARWQNHSFSSGRWCVARYVSGSDEGGPG